MLASHEFSAGLGWGWQGATGSAILTPDHPTHLTPVAVFMEVPPHALNFEGILPIPRDDGVLTDAAHRGEFPRGKGTHA